MSSSEKVEIEGLIYLPDDLGRLYLRPYQEAAPREPNLSCYDQKGEKIWDAEEVQSLDKWFGVELRNARLFANSYGGYLCELDPRDGKIMSSEFVK